MNILSLYEFVSRHARRLSEGIGRLIRRGVDLEQSSVCQELSAGLSIARGTAGCRCALGTGRVVSAQRFVHG